MKPQVPTVPNVSGKTWPLLRWRLVFQTIGSEHSQWLWVPELREDGTETEVWKPKLGCLVEGF